MRISSKKLRALTARLLDDDEEVRYDTACEIASKERLPVEYILLWADDPRPRMRAMACFLLGYKGYTDATETTTAILYPEGVPALLRLLDDPDEEVRSASAIALGSHALPSTLPALLRLASDLSAEVRYALALALSFFWMGDEETSQYKEEVEAVLLRLMEDKEEDVRDWATFAIHNGGHDTPATRTRLWKALDDPNPDVRGEAAEGLAKFGDRTLLPRLEKLLREDEELSPCYFLAAEALGDPALLPAMLTAAQRWREEDHEHNWFIEPTIQSLRDAAERDKDRQRR